MKPWNLIGIALPALALGACAVMPARDAEVDDARAAVRAAQNNPQVVSLAPTELNRAIEAMRRTDAAWENREDLEEVHHLAYLAWTRASIAEETARLKASQASIETENAERDRLQLEARTREADRARREAARAQEDAERAQAQADVNRANAVAAQQQAEQAAKQAQAAREQAEAARAEASSAQARAESLQSALDELHARPTDRGMVVTLGDLLFDTGSAHLSPGGVRVVDRLADFMNAYPKRRVSIEGFTDSVGNPGANQVLSERRADAVRLALIDRGIDPARIIARGYGEEYPVASNSNPAGRQMNRRVEIVISDVNGVIASRNSPTYASPRG
ncbi:MAG TPA: OmpA family protein [Casimicrobiaceae bacterium]|nr:OmpA family protein [Casimicrobiaceae bacterium]